MLMAVVSNRRATLQFVFLTRCLVPLLVCKVAFLANDSLYARSRRISIMNLFPSKSQERRESGSVPSKRLLAALILAAVMFSVFYLVSPNWPWQAPVSDDTGLVTRVDLGRISIEKGAGDAGPVIAVHAKNSSKSRASEISLGFSGGVDTQLLAMKAPKDALHADAALKPGQELDIPVVSVQQFLAAFQSKCSGCYFLGVGETVTMPTEIAAALCKEVLQKGRSCHLEFSIVPIFLTRQFKTPFGDSVSGAKPVFVYLSRSVKTEYSVPKN